jgi:hypothetical protein
MNKIINKFFIIIFNTFKLISLMVFIISIEYLLINIVKILKITNKLIILYTIRNNIKTIINIY